MIQWIEFCAAVNQDSAVEINDATAVYPTEDWAQSFQIPLTLRKFNAFGCTNKRQEDLL